MNTRDVNVTTVDPVTGWSGKGKVISWKAIVAGAVTAVGLTFLFNLLTLGLGLTQFVTNEKGLEHIAFVGFSWLFVGGFVILFIAGWVTGRSVCRGVSLHSCTGMKHGFLAWSLYLIISVLMLASLPGPSAMVSNSFNTMSAHKISLVNDTGTNTVTSTNNTGTVTPNLTPEERVNAEKTAHAMGVATVATFLIFAAGALGCTLGAACGIDKTRRCGYGHCTKEVVTETNVRDTTVL